MDEKIGIEPKLEVPMSDFEEALRQVLSAPVRLASKNREPRKTELDVRGRLDRHQTS